ncbi:Multicopper oxidase [Glomus cerebriforme]|uniref:Multicopper oxidase n=1 Tax=Glomus cerebriforme TaxID=658196 RepID=A0A397SEU8_9GLOM|nr:Multicopper oxidase [Glomus cerebriforme]
MFIPFLPLQPTPSPITRYYELVLSRVNLAPDGFMREILSINSQYPGTMIHANKGDRLHITVRNQLGVPTSMHWHGIQQRGSNWYDGVSGQTQCPIPNGISFEYDFSTGEQQGTYWYHAHTHGQYMEGLRAPLIIHDPNDPYRKDYDEEYVITMSDWYHQSITELLEIRMSPNYGGFNPIPDAGLISGIGRYDCSAAPPNSNCQANNPLAVYKFQSGKRYRLRIMNTSGLTHFIFSIDNHPLKIIEADGEYSQPVTVNKLPVAIGQRYSVIVEANQQVDNYWIRATIDNRCLLTNDSTVNVNSAINYNVTGILRYEGAPITYPTTTEYPDAVRICLGLAPNFLKSLYPRSIPGPATDRIVLNLTMGIDENNVGRAYVNNSTYVVDETHPTIEKLLTNRMTINQLPTQQNIYSYDNLNGVADFYVLNANRAVHPFHMHGHNFYVLGTGPGLVVDESMLNLVNPFPRDTFVLDGNSWSVFRIITDNPGIWSVHCHIDWHIEMGMVAQLVELPSELTKFTVPQSVTNLCAQFSASKKRSLSTRSLRRNNRRTMKVESN